jgi:hypothetical protein
MNTHLMSRKVLILCDYDALYAAVELQLSALPEAQVIRLKSNSSSQLAEALPADNPDLMIVATVAPVKDPMALLSKASLLNRVGETPVLIISEQPSRPESDDKITYLNFPFDIDQLSSTVKDILDKCPPAD